MWGCLPIRLAGTADRLSDKDGWYATAKNGNLVSGPFSCRDGRLMPSNQIIVGAANADASVWA
jgi:hypothetical protein